MHARCRSAVVLCGFMVAATSTASSSASAATLRVAPRSACGDAAELVHRVEQGMGSALSEAPPLHFDLAIAREGRAVVARLGTQAEGSARRERRLAAPDCATLSETVAVAIALALGDAEAALEPATGQRPSVLAGAPPPEVTKTSAADAVAREGVPEADRAAGGAAPAGVSAGVEPSLSVWLAGDVGSLPVPSLGATLAAELRWARWALVALGSVLFDRDAGVGSASAPRAGATLGLALGALLACARAPVGARFVARACAGAELGRLTGVGTGISDPRPGASLWVAPRLDAAGFTPIAGTPLRVGLWLTAAAPANRDELVIEGVGRAHRPPAIVGRAAIGAELRFE